MSVLKKYSILVTALAVFSLAFTSLMYSPLSSLKDTAKENTILEGEFFYWFALSDFGNINWIDRELKFISQNKSADSVTQSEEQAAFISDLVEQRDMAHDTLAGIFPLYRFLFKKILFSPEELNPFEIIDDIEVIAATTAVNNQIHTLMDNWKAIPHFDVLFVSDPVNVSLENEALYLFNRHSKFFVHSLKEKKVFLDKYGFAETDLTATNIKDEVLEALRNHFGASHFIIASVSKQASPEQGGFYVAESKVLDLQAGRNITIRNMGFAIDSSSEFSAAIQLTCIAFICGFILLFLAGIVKIDATEVSVSIGVYLISFLFMLILISLSGSLLATFIYVPSMEVLAISGWWVIPMAMLMTMVIPSLLIFAIVERLKPSSFLRYVEASDVALLAVLQAIFCWMVFLYLIYANSAADQLTIALISIIPLLLFNSWKNKIIGLDFAYTSVFSIELCLILVLIMTAAPIWILTGLAFILLAHFTGYKIFTRFVGLAIQKPVSQPIPTNGPITSQVSEKIVKLINSDKSPSVLIITSDDSIYANNVFDMLCGPLSRHGNLFDIKAMDCLTDYSLVSKIVGRHIEASSDSFDTALGVASDLIPFGSLISERASTSDVKDNHIQECGFMHFKAQYEKFQYDYLVIRDLSLSDELSINWLNFLTQKPWSSKLKICILTASNKLAEKFSTTNIYTYRLNQMDVRQAENFLTQYPVLTKSIREIILKELSNETTEFWAHDLQHFGHLATQVMGSNSQLSESGLLAEIKTAFGNSADEEKLNIMNEVCSDPLLKQFMAAASYMGPEIDLVQLSIILDIDIKTIFKLIDEINTKHWLFVDPKSARLCIVFRSVAFQKTCYQYFQFHKNANQQTSFSQVMASYCAKVILTKNEISIERRHELLSYLCAVEFSERDWLFQQLLLTSKQQLFDSRPMQADSFLQMAKMLFEKLKSNMSDRECNYAEREIESINLLQFLTKNNESVSQKGKKVEKFFRRWGIWPEEDADLIYLKMRSLYDARFNVETATFMLKKVSEELLEIDKNFPTWLRAELLHYKQLANIHLSQKNSSTSEKQAYFNDLRAALEMLETDTDYPSELATYSRIATTLISQDPFGEDIYSLADKAIEIKNRLFDTEGVAIAKGAIARASFFIGEEYVKNSNYPQARHYLKDFQIKVEEWKSASSKTSAPTSVMIMIENLKAQANIYLGQIDEKDESFISHAFVIIKAVMEMKIIPDTNEMSVFRQLVSTHSILLELQLLDNKYTKEFSLDETKNFYQRFKSQFDPYLSSKFEILIKNHELGWDN
jgi:tetratricopeptide (TPR) repeat protein